MNPFPRFLNALPYGKLFFVLAAQTALVIPLLAARMHITGHLSYLFLWWNLFLAWIPAWAALGAHFAYKNHRPRFALALGALWLLFLPNAPYILTDFIHLHKGIAPLWFDLILIGNSAFVGLMLGFVSLSIMQDLVMQRWRYRTAFIFCSAAIALSSFGIYLGRFLRWNSWDIIRKPMNLVADIGDIVLHPMQHPRAVGATLLFTLFLAFGYLGFRVLAKSKA